MNKRSCFWDFRKIKTTITMFVCLMVLAALLFGIDCIRGLKETTSTAETILFKGIPVYPKEEPETAHVFKECFVQDCVAPLTINTTGSQGYYFVVDLISSPDELGMDKFSKEYYDLQAKTVFYVRGGDSIELDVPLGLYEIYYATGEMWYGDGILFGPDTVYHMCEEQFIFTEDENGYNGWTIELHPVPDGNLDTKIIDKAEFPLP